MKNSKFSLVLKQLRENAGLTQKQVANALGIERSTYAYYETGASHPNGKTIVKLAAVFDISYNTFMDAIADSDFDNNPEDVSFTTLSDESAAMREKIYTLKTREQNLVLNYRLLTTDDKDKIDEMIDALRKKEESGTDEKK